ncbi:protein kinase domain-containing protein [Desulfothermobacter acidiphilus]|uniref:protein kinase domain-containing protein n=1 Tax=Desulfothermobacter acidiphilus TaxID=1938353 RepID=UPI003F894637
MIDRVLSNRYRVIREIGSGGMAVVYEGRDLVLDRPVTIKVLREEFARDPEFVQRFRQEAMAVASLSHPHIVSLYDVGEDNGTHYLVMEYVEGRDLKTLIENREITIPWAIRIAKDICSALEHAHRRGIVHRDVKPHNILITPEGEAKLTDFGIARTMRGSTIAATRAFLGSVEYISPEQARGEQADARSDIYALGAVLYEMLTFTPPFTGDNPVAVALKHVEDQPPPPSQLNPRIPPALERVVMRAMAKNPAARYPSAAAMARELGAVDLKKKPRAFKWGYLVIPPLLLLLVFLGGWWWLRSYTDVPEVTMPNVCGLPLTTARQTLSDLGLRVQVEETHSGEVEKGIVIKQSVDPGTKVKKGRLINLLVSLGPEMRTVPDVRNRTLAEAEALLRAEGFVVGRTTWSYNPQASGTVIDQDPLPGVSRPKGSQVNLVVSQGPEKPPQAVPDVRGQSLESATSQLQAAGFTVDPQVLHASSNEYLPGFVCAQQPAAGTLLPPGGKVQLTVSDGPGPTPHQATVNLVIPPDGKTHQIKIVVQDARGTVDAYQGVAQPGEQIKQTVTYYGKAKIGVYVDGVLVKEQTLG